MRTRAAPWGRDRGVSHSAAIQGRMTPRFGGYIVNFPTKRHWRGNSRMEDIEAGLRSLVDVIRARNIRSVAIPPLASGLGSLAWVEVRRHLEESLRSLDDLDERHIVIFEPRGAPEAAHMARKREPSKMTPTV